MNFMILMNISILSNSVPANKETVKFLEENLIFTNEEGVYDYTFDNPDPERLRVVFEGNDMRPACLAVVGTKAFGVGSAHYSWWAHGDKEGLLNLEERIDGLYSI